MADPDNKIKHFKHRQKNLLEKALFDPNEHRGAFSMKVVDSRKQNYKRKKMRVTEIEQETD